MIKIAPAQLGHMDFFELTDKYDGFNLTREQIAKSIDSNVSFSLIKKKEVLCFVGMTEFFEGNCEVWLIPSKQIYSHLKEVINVLRQLVDNLFNKMNMFRIQMTISEKIHNHVNWAKMLHFEYEGIKRHYNKEGHNFYMYSRVKDGS